MKSYKDLLNEAAHRSPLLKEMDADDMKALKRCILDIYKKVYEVCEGNGLRVILAEGSCLGAVRHKGFIPWDDDLDVMMPRPDLDRFIALCEEGALGDEYPFRHPQGKLESSSPFMKVYMRNTELLGIGGRDNRFPQMVFLDIFPIEGIPSNKLWRQIKGLLANTMRLIGNTVMECGTMTNEMREFYKTDKLLYKMVRKRRMIGRCFSFISHKQWVSWYDKLVRCSDMSGLIGIPTARKLYDGETLPASVYLPPVSGEFEGVKVWLPADTHRYLENLYGNYMWIPPVEKREQHFIREMKIPNKYYQDKKNDKDFESHNDTYVP